MILTHNEDVPSIQAYAEEVLEKSFPNMPRWIITGLAVGIAQTTINAAEKLHDNAEVLEFINSRMEEVINNIPVSASVWDSDEQFAKLAHFITNTVEWGTMAIEVKGGKPVMIRDYRKDIKL